MPGLDFDPTVLIVSLIPALDKTSAPKDVAFVQIREPWATMQLCMAWRSSDSSPVLTGFLDVVRSSCRKAAARNRWPRIGAKR